MGVTGSPTQYYYFRNKIAEISFFPVVNFHCKCAVVCGKIGQRCIVATCFSQKKQRGAGDGVRWGAGDGVRWGGCCS